MSLRSQIGKLFFLVSTKSKGERERTKEEKEENCDILSKVF
jgi:hypothetical protein